MSRISAREKWLLEKIKGRVVVDIGFVGQKTVLPAYVRALRVAKSGIIYIGLDINHRAILNWRMTGSVAGDAGAIPIGDSRVDYVIMGEFLEHHIGIESFIAEAHRILRLNGKLVITTPNPFFINRMIKNWLFRSLNSIATAQNLNTAMAHEDHRTLWDPLSLMSILKRFGFDIEEISARGVWLPFLGLAIPRFRQGIDLKIWPFSRIGYITCIICTKKMG